MKQSLLDVLACPECGVSKWNLTVYTRLEVDGVDEIEDALLSCGECRSRYPVVGCIPRMLPDSMADHAAYMVRYGVGTPSESGEVPGAGRRWSAASFRRLHKSTQSSFGFEWLRYKVTGYLENVRFFRLATGFTPDKLRGRRVLDAGCGMGRFLEVASSWGAEVVGLDLSRSVERAWRESRFQRRIHVVQGDIMNPPFVEGAFASAYSIGVLHHTPDTRTAFRSIVDLVRPGGRISIWVYRTFQPEIEVREYKRMFATFQELASDGTRIVTTRLPHQLLHWLCHAAVPLGWVKMKVDDGKIPKVLGWPFLLLPISSHREWRVRICDTFDWLSPRYQWKHTSAEVFGWFEAADLQSIQKQELSVSVTGVRPVRREGEDPLDVANALEAEAMAG